MPVCIEQFRLPRYREIPDIGLYLDQTVKYINQYLEPAGLPEMTASMVSNYVKKGYIKSPVKKQYSAEQIGRLFSYAIIKTVLPMEDIAKLHLLQQTLEPFEKAYDFFCGELEIDLKSAFRLGTAAEEKTVKGMPGEELLQGVTSAVANVIFLRAKIETLQISDNEYQSSFSGNK